MFLDCGNIDRMPVSFLRRDDGAHRQHRPPPRQHQLRHREPGRGRRVLHRRDHLRPDRGPRRRRSRRAIAEALYVGLVTDTGKFQYENTTPASHRMAADLIERGVDVHEVFRRLYENVPFAKLQLLARVLCAGRALRRRPADRSPTSSARTTRRPAPTRTTPRASSTTCARSRARSSAALVREQLKEGREGISKVSLRAATDDVDVSVIARKEGGGGHRQAAGFSTEKPPDELVDVHPRRDRSPASTCALTVASADAVVQRRPAGRQAGRARPRTTSSTRVRALARRRAGRRWATRARSTRSRPGLLLVLVGPGHALPALSSWRCPRPTARDARFGAVSDTGDPTGAIEQTGARRRRGRRARRAARARRARSTSGCRSRRRSRSAESASTARPGGARSSRRPCAGARRRASSWSASTRRRRRRELEVECSSGTYVRQLVADLGERAARAPTARRSSARRSARSGSRDADEERLVPLVEALSFMPGARARRRGGAARPNRAGGRRRRRADRGRRPDVRLTADGELVAVAERRDGKLKPVTVIPVA